MRPCSHFAVLIAFGLLLSLACASGSNDGAGPVAPTLDQTPGASMEAGSAGHYLWGYWLVSMDPASLECEIVPLRQAEGHWNVVQFLEQAPCKDCFKLAGVSPNPDGTLNVDVSIKHPFANKNLTGFDVRGIAMFNGTHEFPSSGLYISDRTKGEGEVVNADGYTTLFNRFTVAHGFEGYIKGKLATVIPPTATPNAFKRFVSDDPANTRNAFYAGDEIVVTYRIHMPDPPKPWVFGYAVDACWAPPIYKPVEDPMTDFSLSANCPEAWQISAMSVGEGLTDCWGQVSVVADVYDWQGKDDAHPVVVECPELFDGEVEATWKADSVGFTTYEAVVENTKHAPAGTYKCLVSKEASENDPSKYWLNITAYQLCELEVVAEIKQAPTAIAEASQLSAYTWDPISFDASGSHDNDCGDQSIVKYEWDWDADGTYDFGYAKAVHSWGTEGSHYVQLRVTDNEGQTAVLDSPMEITILKGGAPFDITDVTPPWLNFSPHDVCIDGNYAYVAGSVNGLHIFDISDPANPVWINRVDTPGEASGVAVSGGYAYIADYRSGLQIIDIDPPESAYLVKSVDTPGGAHSVAVSAGYAYVADGDSQFDILELQIIDIDPPESACIVESVDTPGEPQGVAVSGGYAYVADGRLEIVDIDPPEAAYVVKSVDTPHSAYDVEVSGGFAYVADDDSGLQIIDINLPESAYIVSSVDTPGNALGITVSGGYAYVADYDEGLQIIDIDPPESANVVKSVATPGLALAVAISGGYAYVADDSSGLQVVSVDPPESAGIVKSVDTPGEAGRVALSGGYAYVADYSAGLQIIDIEPPESPCIVKAIDTPAYALGVAVSGGYAYFADGRLEIADIDPPELAYVVKSVVTPDWANEVAVSGGYAYVADSYSGLQIIDIDPLESAYIVKSVTLSYSTGVAVAGGYTYVTDDYGLKIIDIDPPESAYIVKSVDTPVHANGVAVSGGYAYVVGGGLQIIDIELPESAYIVQSVDTPDWAYGVAVSGGYAYIADLYSGLQIIDIDPPESAYIVKSVDTPGGAIGVAVSGGYAYVADCSGGLRVFKLW